MRENIEQRARQTSQIGQSGEDTAALYLVKNGYSVVARNFSLPIGRNKKGTPLTGEIDIIARKGNEICFVEVKTTTDPNRNAEDAVTSKKRRLLTRTAIRYLELFDLRQSEARFDIIAISLNGQRAPQINHLMGAWQFNILKKNRSDRDQRSYY